jgi:hypothetical protein
MRATISVLVSSFLLTSLAFNCQAKVNRLSQMLISNSGSQELSSDFSEYQAQLRDLESPILHRGSGRISFTQKSGDHV